MKISYDLHIHTALSPCASDDMTPNNIVNMALLKGLDVIAVTDHNSALNCAAVIDAAKNTDLLVIPGMELQTTEEVHLLCFFEQLTNLFTLQKEIESRMVKIKNKPELFGHQWIIDKEDLVVGEISDTLLISSGLSLKETVHMVNEMGGIVIPSHIERNHNSIIVNLGFIPKDLDFIVLEISKFGNLEDLLEKFTFLNHYKYIINSDAHDLGSISESIRFIETEVKSVRSVIDALKNGKGVV